MEFFTTAPPSRPSDFPFSPWGGKSSGNAFAPSPSSAWLASASRAHAVIANAVQTLAQATAQAHGQALAIATCAAIAEAATALALKEFPIPPPAALAAHTARLKASPAGAKIESVISNLARDAHNAGYAAGQADLVLALMLTEVGRKVLQGLAAIAAQGEATTGGAAQGKTDGGSEGRTRPA